jgi:hypothetical protein
VAVLAALMPVTIATLGACATTREPPREPSVGAAEPHGSPAASDQQEASDPWVFESGGETYQVTWQTLPGGTFEMALPAEVARLDTHVTDKGRIQIWSHEREHVAAHADAPDEEALRGRIVLTSKTVEDDQARSFYREEFAQSLSDGVILEDRTAMGVSRRFGEVDGVFWEQVWRFPDTDPGRSYVRVNWTTSRFEIERDRTISHIVLLAPEAEAEKFRDLFLQALETLRERE